MRRNYTTCRVVRLLLLLATPLGSALGCGNDVTIPDSESTTESPDAGGTYDSWSGESSPPVEPPIVDASQADALPDSTPSSPLPAVWTAPKGEELPCENRLLSFDFDIRDKSFGPINAFWMMWFAMRAFVSDDPATRDELASLGFHRYAHFEHDSSGLQAMVAGSDHVIVVSFRGSTEIQDYLNNAKFRLIDGDKAGVSGRLHAGFGRVLGDNWQGLSDLIHGFSDNDQEIWLSGHSLGGALATIAAARLARQGYDVAGVYSFAGPRAGNSAFARDVLNRLKDRSFRVVNHLDLTPRIPPAGIAAEEAAQLLRFNPLERLAADAIRDLDYAHASTMYLFDEGTALSLVGTNGDWEDKAFWTERAEHVRNLTGLINDDRDHGKRHDHRTYLCKMQQLRDAAFVK